MVRQFGLVLAGSFLVAVVAAVSAVIVSAAVALVVVLSICPVVCVWITLHVVGRYSVFVSAGCMLLLDG